MHRTPLRLVSVTLRILVAAGCCVGMFFSWRLAQADYLFQQDTEDSLRAAIHIAPDAWTYYLRLAQADPLHARELLTTSLRLNRYNAEAEINLGLECEAAGDYATAEKLLLAAFEVDHTYIPRWSLANFYFRRDNSEQFWIWARKAAEVPADDIRPLFELCWHAAPDAETVTKQIVNDKPEFLRQYLDFLNAKYELTSAATVGGALVHAENLESDRWRVFLTVNRLVEANNGSAANSLWQEMIQQHWVAGDSTIPNNPDFLRAPLPVSLDWNLPEYEGLHSWPGYAGLQTEFTGREPEECKVAEQAVVLSPGKYAMTVKYHTTDIAAGSGLHWELVDTKGNILPIEFPDLSSDQPADSTVVFSIPKPASVFKVRLSYRRALGQPRISGMLVISSIRIQSQNS